MLYVPVQTSDKYAVWDVQAPLNLLKITEETDLSVIGWIHNHPFGSSNAHVVVLLARLSLSCDVCMKLFVQAERTVMFALHVYIYICICLLTARNAFLSSVDQHMAYLYQKHDPMFVSLVVDKWKNVHGFQLSGLGMSVLSQCKKGFKPHRHDPYEMEDSAVFAVSNQIMHGQPFMNLHI
jgi:hypothetical protein